MSLVKVYVIFKVEPWSWNRSQLCLIEILAPVPRGWKFLTLVQFFDWSGKRKRGRQYMTSHDFSTNIYPNISNKSWLHKIRQPFSIRLWRQLWTTPKTLRKLFCFDFSTIYKCVEVQIILNRHAFICQPYSDTTFWWDLSVTSNLY